MGKLINATLVATLLLIPAYATQRARRPTGAPSLALNLRVSSFQLKNGLRVLVNEDPSVPHVAVELWILAGSRQEEKGQFGFAHLYEHMNGARRLLATSENREAFHSHAIDTNAQTRMDYVRYFAMVPKTSLDLALAAMADRLDSDPNSLTQARLDGDRNIVLNEIRRAEERGFRNPAVEFRLRQGSFGQHHPYAHEVYGLKQDLSEVTLDQMRSWALKHQGATNAMLIVAGNVSSDSVRERVEHYFGSIPPGTPLERPVEWVPQLRDVRRDVMEANVPRGIAYLSWPGPRWGSADADYVLLMMEILASPVNARLHDVLVRKQRSAEGVFMDPSLWQLASKFTVGANLGPNADPVSVTRTIEEEIEKLLSSGPSEAELARAKGRLSARFIRSWEQIGFNGERLQAIGEGALFVGDPLYSQTRLRRIEQATIKDVVNSGRRWLGQPGYVLTVKPKSNYATSSQAPDRTKLPRVPPPPTPVFPKIQQATLSNGLQILLVERDSLPLVELRLIANTPRSKSQPTDRVLADVMLALLSEGTTTRSGEQIRYLFDSLGTNWTTSANRDLLTIGMSSLSNRLEASLELLSDILLNPIFSQSQLQRVKDDRIAQINRATGDPLQRRWRTLAHLLYGVPIIDAPAATSGDAEMVGKIERGGVVKLWRSVLRPNNATLIVAGDVSMQDLVPKLNRLLAGWKPVTQPEETRTTSSYEMKSGLYVVDRPASSQSFILTALTSKRSPTLSVIRVNAVVALLNRRLNLNLRERKQWTYGVELAALSSRDEDLLYIDVPVQTDSTADAVSEIIAELKVILGDGSITVEDMKRVRDLLKRSIAHSIGTLDDVTAAVTRIVRFELPLNYYQEVMQTIEALSPEDITRAANELLKPDAFAWIIVGDRAAILPKLQKLDRFAEIRVVSRQTPKLEKLPVGLPGLRALNLWPRLDAPAR